MVSLNLKKLNEVESKKECQVEILNSFAVLDHLDTGVRARETFGPLRHWG
jgi:hypothetical protein